MKILGEKLREARTKGKISLKTLHKRTKISLDTIEAIEEGNTSHLPVAYYIAFVRTLSREVGLNPDSLLREYNSRQRRLLEEKIQMDDREGLDQKIGNFWSKWSRWIVLGIIGSGLLILVGLYILYGRQLFTEPDIAERYKQTQDTPTQMTASSDSGDTNPFVLHAISLNNAWIVISVDSGRYENVYLRRGEKREWPAVNTISVSLEDPKSVRLSLDDQLLDWSGDAWSSGISLRITGAGITHASPREDSLDHLDAEEDDLSMLALVGQIDPDTLYQKFPVYQKNQMDYQPNSVILSRIESLDPHLDLICFLGTWYPLSEDVVPKLLRILEMSYMPYVTLTLIGVHPNMTDDAGLVQQHRIQGLPTILFVMDQLEVGRIVGQPGERIESQFLEIVERANLFLKRGSEVQSILPRGSIGIIEE